MRRFKTFAAGASGLALVLVGTMTWGEAEPSHSASIGVSGTVPAYCTIGLPIITGTNTGSASTTNYDASFNFTTPFGNNFADNSTGKGIAGAGEVHYTVTSNAGCIYSLSSTRGTLATADNANTRTYSAQIFNTVNSNTASATLSSIGPQTIGGFTIPAGATIPATSYIGVKFSFSATDTMLAAGDYSDTLVMTVTPTH